MGVMISGKQPLFGWVLERLATLEQIFPKCFVAIIRAAERQTCYARFLKS